MAAAGMPSWHRHACLPQFRCSLARYPPPFRPRHSLQDFGYGVDKKAMDDLYLKHGMASMAGGAAGGGAAGMEGLEALGAMANQEGMPEGVGDMLRQLQAQAAAAGQQAQPQG